MKTEQKKLELENILTVSAQEYCTANGKNLKDYRLEGVHFWAIDMSDGFQDGFECMVPAGAEVVVEFQQSIGGTPRYYTAHYAASGTALIPKRK